MRTMRTVSFAARDQYIFQNVINSSEEYSCKLREEIGNAYTKRCNYY